MAVQRVLRCMRSLLPDSLRAGKSFVSGSAVPNEEKRRLFRSVGMIASANILSTGLAMIGSLVQAHFIVPDDLGFVRKYSVISGYAIFLNLGLFNILQREYPVLIGRGDKEQARRVVAIGQTWCLLAASVVCGVLFIICLVEFIQGRWREGLAWFIQVVSVLSILYGGYLNMTFRSGEEFERLAQSSFLSSFIGILVLPLFIILPFGGLVLRSVAGPAAALSYLHAYRPVRVGFCLPLKELASLIKRGLRLFFGAYLYYNFWFTVEIWLMLTFAGDAGVGLFVFSLMIVESLVQLTTAVNQIYMPRLAQEYGRSGSLTACLKMSIKPTILNVTTAIILSLLVQIIMPRLIALAFPHYLSAVPLLDVLVLNTILVGLGLPVFMITVLEDYGSQTIATLVGGGVFIGLSFLLYLQGWKEMAVIWGTIVGRSTFIALSLASLVVRAKRIRPFPIAETAS